MRGVFTLLVAAACSSSSADAPDAAIDSAPGGPTAQQLLARIASCGQVIGGTFSDDAGGTANRSICALPKAMFWKADMDIDCDGKTSPMCNATADPAYQNQTAATDSKGDPLDAAVLPYVVVPSVSTKFDYAGAGLELGTVIAVIYNDKIAYGVFGDTGPTTIIGEASYAMATELGMDPDPSTGGADTGVAYIAFVGAMVDPIEDHAKAVTIGTAHAKALLATP